jgi:hypothetical protein
MAPAFAHPPGVNFVDDHGEKPVNVDAAIYYGGEEAYSRSRTYSGVCLTHLLLGSVAHHRRRPFPMATIPSVPPPLEMSGTSGRDECRTTRRALLQVQDVSSST